MAFAQQRRRPTQQRHHTNDEDLYSDHHHQASFVPTSDSDNDWHVISSALPTTRNTSNTSTSNASPILIPTPTTSESDFRPSDIESLATTTDQETEEEENETTFLPSHDGTGTFVVEDVDFFSSDQNTTSQDESCCSSSSEDGTSNSVTEFTSALQNITSADNSILDILMTNTRTPPSFATTTTTTTKQAELPNFVPTVAGLNSEELFTNGVSLSQTSLSAGTKNRKKKVIVLSEDDEEEQDLRFTTKRQRNLDRIPIHHPAIPGSSTSQAILSIVWDRLKRLTNHLIENDTNTVETISNLMSEAVLEGFMPFGSHLHMEINPRNYYSLLEGWSFFLSYLFFGFFANFFLSLAS